MEKVPKLAWRLLMIIAIALLIFGITRIQGRKSDKQFHQQTAQAAGRIIIAGKDWKKIDFPIYAWIRIDPIDGIILFKLSSGELFIQKPGGEINPIINGKIDTTKSGLGNEIPDNLFFIKEKSGHPVRVLIMTWPKNKK